MKTTTFTTGRRASNRESGQVMLFVLLGLGIFLIGSLAFAVDMSFLWFERQTAQTAADAACTAGAMDLLEDATSGITAGPWPGHLPPTGTLDCNGTNPNADSQGTTNPSPCVYAALNGFPSSLTKAAAAGGAQGDNVFIDFGGAAPPGVTGYTYLMEVDVTQNMPTFFAGMLLGKSAQTVRAVAKCGVQSVAAPIPLIVLDPLNPDSKTSAFNIDGNPIVDVYGGPTQSIQVNSDDPLASFVNGNALVNLSLGGPGTPPTGSSFGLVGGPIQPNACTGSAPSYKSGYCGGTTGSWQSGDSLIPDPLAGVQAPTITGSPVVLSAATFPTWSGPTPPLADTDADGVNGCSSNKTQCDRYLPGYYPNGICLGTSCGGGATKTAAGANGEAVATFVEGLYVVAGSGLTLQSNSCARMSTLPDTSVNFPGWGGAIFYFVGSATLNVSANAGSNCNALFTVDTGGPTGHGVYCDANSASHPPGNLPAGTTLTGNVLLAPCFGNGTTLNPYGDSYLAAGKSVPSNPGTQRGILFFQDRSAQGVGASTGGGGSYAMAGTFYFHSCSAAAIGGQTATTCTQPTGTYSTGQYFNDTLDFQGNSGATSYILGEIIVDNLSMSGDPTIFMDLDPNSANNTLKAALYQ